MAVFLAVASTLGVLGMYNYARERKHFRMIRKCNQEGRR